MKPDLKEEAHQQLTRLPEKPQGELKQIEAEVGVAGVEDTQQAMEVVVADPLSHKRVRAK